MRDTVARSLFQRLGGKVVQSERRPEREVWVLRKPSLRAPLKTVSALRQKHLWKAFRMAHELMVERAQHGAQLWRRPAAVDA